MVSWWKMQLRKYWKKKYEIYLIQPSTFGSFFFSKPILDPTRAWSRAWDSVSWILMAWCISIRAQGIKMLARNTITSVGVIHYDLIACLNDFLMGLNICNMNWSWIFETYPHMHPHFMWNYHKTSNIRRTKYQNINVSRVVLQLSLPNPLKPGVKSIMRM